MAAGFLDQVVMDLRRQHGDRLEDLCVVLPSRRAVVFFREALARIYGKTLWAPQIMSIQDAIRQQSGWQFPEPLRLNFELYQVYLQEMQAVNPGWYEPFEKFYPWGEMLIRDFDEVDKYCVDTSKLFSNIKDLREIELQFELPPEDLEALQQFWSSIRVIQQDDSIQQETSSEVQQAFLRIWAILGPVYEAFRTSLKDRFMGYDGMAYRHLVEQLESGGFILPFRQLIFVGFNALSVAEERIIAHLLKKEQAVVYWDAAKAFFPELFPGETTHWGLKALGEESGRFVREFHLKWQHLSSRLILQELSDHPKTIHLTGLPSQVSQAHHLSELLQGRSIQPKELRQYAIVLGDEDLLFPVLYALPDAISRLNITMGFPLRQTVIYQLIYALCQLIRKSAEIPPGEERLFPYQEILALLDNPYLQQMAPQKAMAVRRAIVQRNLLLVPEQFLEHQQFPALVAQFFTPPSRESELLTYIQELFDQLLKEAEEKGYTLEAEYLFHLFTQFNQLADMLVVYNTHLSIKGFADIFLEVLKKSRIPF
ncbi:MAG: hypothetical protein AAGI38_14920, partial [Bacteroidota bacterium]